MHRIQCKKCKVLHVGRNNKKFEYFMNGEKLDSVDSERDIGVIVDKSLKPSLQASGVLTQITRALLYRDRNTFLKLYIQFVRCYLEFSIPALSPVL